MTKPERRPDYRPFTVIVVILGSIVSVPLLNPSVGGPQPGRLLPLVTAELRGLLRAQDAYRAQRPEVGYASSLEDLVYAGLGSGAERDLEFGLAEGMTGLTRTGALASCPTPRSFRAPGPQATHAGPRPTHDDVRTAPPRQPTFVFDRTMSGTPAP